LRNINKLSVIVEIPRQLLYSQAKTYNWKARAEAYDKYLGELTDKVENLPPPPDINPITTDEMVIEPDIIDNGKITPQIHRHQTEVKLYQGQFRELGKNLADEAIETMDLARKCRNLIKEDADRYRKAIEAGQHDKALSIAKRISEKIKQYTMLGNLAVSYGNSSRALWGDAIGINAVLQSFYALQQNVKPDTKSRR
jgi:dsDNA-binding SOS-regulon protein